MRAANRSPSFKLSVESLLEVTNGVVYGLALVLAVEQEREVVGTQP